MDTQTKRLKIGIYNPYFDSLGGGERYVLTLAEHWSKTHDVSVFWDDTEILQKAIERFGLDLQTVSVTPNVFARRHLVRKLIVTSGYDLLFFLSDGSVPMTLARHNIIHFQVPFASVAVSAWKAARYDRAVVNSEFTKNNLDKNMPIPVTVIYPPVAAVRGSVKTKKQQTILSVGRFNALYGAKKQDILIGAFIEMQKRKQCTDWKLILAGGALPTDAAYVNSLVAMADGYNIEFQVNCSYETLQTLYGKSSVYWHAAGFGETDPSKMEHFGITTVEAMSAGCIPVVYNAGGQPEIITNQINGYLWRTTDELITHTVAAAKMLPAAKNIIAAAKETAMKFSKKSFNEQYDTLLDALCK